MLEFAINAESVDESNLFLRKLWCELGSICPMAWQYQPTKSGNRISIGYSTLGEVAFDYKVSGRIRNLYIDNKDEEKTDEIKAAVCRAREGKFQTFAVKLLLGNDQSRVIANTSSADLSITVENGQNELLTNISAYSVADAGQWIHMKIWTLRSILYEYTSQIFNLKKIVCAKTPASFSDTESSTYNWDWVDFSEIPTTVNGEIIVPQECLSLLSMVLKDNERGRDIELLLNSARMLFASQQVEKGVPFPNGPGVSDIINSSMISSIEPLASFIDRRVKRCDSCGNLAFSVVSKLRAVLSKYISEGFAKYFSKEFYAMRSELFHEGQMLSNLMKTRTSYPLIDPLNPKEMLMPTGIVLINLAEYSSFVFRQMLHEYYTTGIEVIGTDGKVSNIRYFS